MNTLQSKTVSQVVARLFENAEAADRPLRERLAKLSADERAKLLGQARSDYRGFYGMAREMYLPVSRETAGLLYILARAKKARAIVEYGTSFGISTIHLAAALRDNGGGKLVGSELEASKVATARRNLADAGLADLVDVREGDALETLARDLPPAIDLVLLDGAKVLYPRVLALLEPHLAPGALVVADNADDSPEFVARVRASSAYVSVPVGPDVEVALRV
jgi:predicted O-methyltransferase YrrM